MFLNDSWETQLFGPAFYSQNLIGTEYIGSGAYFRKE